MNFITKIILYPIYLIYRAITATRNYFYEKKIFKSAKFDIPIISVGNLSMGGTGKTPHVEFLIRALKDNYQIATLSRGYKRKTTGFKIAEFETSAAEIGDEPKQFKMKFPEITVSVSEDRLTAIPRIIQQVPNTDIILMDDAFQHRSVKPGLNILLSEYSKPFYSDDVFPLGNLRESNKQFKRADIIIISKCPTDLSENERKDIIRKINLTHYQKIYFSFIGNGPLFNINPPYVIQDIDINTNILLLTGIAENNSLIKSYKSKYSNVFPLEFPDHHLYNRYDLEKITETYKNIPNPKCIVTTEKDAMRLLPFLELLNENKVNVLIQPIFVYFDPLQQQLFLKDIELFIQIKHKKTIDENGELV